MLEVNNKVTRAVIFGNAFLLISYILSIVIFFIRNSKILMRLDVFYFLKVFSLKMLLSMKHSYLLTGKTIPYVHNSPWLVIQNISMILLKCIKWYIPMKYRFALHSRDIHIFVIFSIPFHTFQIQNDKWKWNNLWCHELACINLQM